MERFVENEAFFIGLISFSLWIPRVDFILFEVYKL